VLKTKVCGSKGVILKFLRRFFSGVVSLGIMGGLMLYSYAQSDKERARNNFRN
jgi:hypothetical protein